MKINNTVPPGKPRETESMPGDFLTSTTNLATRQGGEVVSAESNKAMATDAKGIQDVNSQLLIKSLNGKLKESELAEHKSEKKAQYNPKELSVDKFF